MLKKIKVKSQEAFYIVAEKVRQNGMFRRAFFVFISPLILVCLFQEIMDGKN